MFDFIGGKRRNILLYALVIIVCIIGGYVLFVGSKQKTTPVSSQYGYVSFVVQWDSISKHDTSEDILRFCFYPADDGPMIQTDTDSGSLRIALASGKYGLLVYNYGKESFELRNRTHFKNAEVAFREEENGYLKATSKPIYGMVIHEFEVKPNQDVTTTITPTFFTKSVYFKINLPEDHHKHIGDCKGMLSGVSPFLSIPDRIIERNTTTSLSLPFRKNESGFEGQTLLLDGTSNRDDRGETPHELTLYFTLNNGKTMTSTLNLGSGLLDIRQQDILVNIEALMNTISEPEINLTCESIDIYPNIW